MQAPHLGSTEGVACRLRSCCRELSSPFQTDQCLTSADRADRLHAHLCSRRSEQQRKLSSSLDCCGRLRRSPHRRKCSFLNISAFACVFYFIRGRPIPFCPGVGGASMSLRIANSEVDGVTVLELDGRIVLGEESNSLREKLKSMAAAGKKSHLPPISPRSILRRARRLSGARRLSAACFPNS